METATPVGVSPRPLVIGYYLQALNEDYEKVSATIYEVAFERVWCRQFVGSGAAGWALGSIAGDFGALLARWTARAHQGH